MLNGIEMVNPGISSFQHLCARINKSWDDIFIASLHGRELENLTDVVKNGSNHINVFTEKIPDYNSR